MKKELVIASLMLTSPAVLAQADRLYRPDNLVQVDAVEKAKWVFESDENLELPQFIYDPTTGDAKFSHYDVIKASLHFKPVDSKSELFDFNLEGFDPIKDGDQEFEITFQTHNLKTGESYFSGDSTYYAIKKKNTVYLFDCDSTKRCDASPESKSFAVLKLSKEGSIRFVQTADFFNTPYTVLDKDKDEYTDLGTKTKYSLKKQ